MKIEAKIMGDKEVQRKIELLAKKNNKAVKEVIEKAVIIVEGNAKDLCPVDTGRLRSSITHEVKSSKEKHTGKVGSNVDYAPYVEFGTSRMAGRHYLFGGLKNSRKNIINLIKRAIKKVKV